MKTRKLLYPSVVSELGHAIHAYAQVFGSSRSPGLILYPGPVSQSGAAARGSLDLAGSVSPKTHCNSRRRRSL
jgi:hypothetical protein